MTNLMRPTADPAANVMRWADVLAAHSDHPDHLTCTYMTPAHRAVAHQLAQWMREAGFDAVRHDPVGNVIGCYRANPEVEHPAAVVTGSHYDTVRNGGRYDGRLGILLPIAIVADLHARGERLPYDFEVVAFAEEEGVRYGSTFLGSSAFIGTFDFALLDRVDVNGVPMRDAIAGAGLNPADIAASSVNAERVQHYFEVHIEQGPVLLDRGLPVGVVSAIAGSVRRLITLTGLAGHAGTTPMTMRRDAAAAAAEIVLFVESRCNQVPGLVGTVGQLEVPGGSINVIPGACLFSIDVRSGDDAVRDAALADIAAAIDAICTRRGIAWTSEEIMRAPASPCADAQRSAWADAIAAEGVEVLTLPSGAGHDAMCVADIASTSMLFVRCGNGGISHNPLEIVTVDDVRIAAQVVERFLKAVDIAA
ncbi:allantoate amidohydrolase [Alcaligenaceae bacterium B3P038]|nr:allantoate amidohydrolase [Alcaligenaceae bacterium B3P038]